MLKNLMNYLITLFFLKLKFSQPGSKRKLKGMFGSALDPEKEKKYGPNKTLKAFRAYVFGLKIRSFRKTRAWMGYSKRRGT